jgi:type I restriction enzyme R subunit
VKLGDGKERQIKSMVATTFWSSDGRPMSAAQFLESLFGTIPDFFKNEDQLREIWSDPGTRKALLAGLADKGFGREALAEMQRAIEAENSDLFDVLAYGAYTRAPIPRTERAESAKGQLRSTYSNYKQLAFLDFVLEHYVDEGVDELDLEKLTPLLRLRYHAIADASAELGSPAEIRHLFVGFQKHLYRHG